MAIDDLKYIRLNRKLNLLSSIPVRSGGLIKKGGRGKLSLSFREVPSKTTLKPEEAEDILKDIAEEDLCVAYINRKTRALENFAFSSQLVLPEKGYVVMNDKTPLVYIGEDKLPEGYKEYFENLATAF